MCLPSICFHKCVRLHSAKIGCASGILIVHDSWVFIYVLLHEPREMHWLLIICLACEVAV